MKKTLFFLFLILFFVFLCSGCSKEEISEKTDYITVFHVASEGTENGDGTENNPFRSIEEAQAAARASGKGTAVLLHTGTYMTEGLLFKDEDSGITYAAAGDGKVILNGGIFLQGEDFVRPEDSFLDRLSEQSARDNIYCVDLKNYGLTKENWGNLHAVGTYSTASKYAGDYTGNNCELFWNDKRQVLARWPNDTYEKVINVPDQGEPHEYPSQNYHYDYQAKNENAAGAYKISPRAMNRAGNWEKITDVWLFGCFMYNWADSSTPLLSVDTENNILYPKFVSLYGVKEGAEFYFYNIPEELDIPGEWYLDRETGILYVCTDTDPKEAEILFTYRDTSVITLSGANDMTFRGFTVLGNRGDAVSVSGNGNRMESMTVKNIMGNAFVVSGSDNTISSCDISHTGRGGILISGGDRTTLTRGNNLAINNYIHDWAEVYTTYQAGVSLNGCGNTASHNEFFNTPHEAIYFAGNDHTIEYNYLHEVVLASDDAGAIYGGRDWTAFGTVIRYNLLVNIGVSTGFEPNGIYLDDALSGIEVYGNILYRIGDNAIAGCGGRNLSIHDNIVVSEENGISFDQRARDGYFFDGWYQTAVADSSGTMWKNLNAVPYKEGIWAERYPDLAKIKDTYEDPDDPDFGPNPAYAEIRNNLLICETPLDLSDYVKKYGTVDGNTFDVYDNEWQYFDNAEKGDFTFAQPEKMPEIPVEEIGRNWK